MINNRESRDRDFDDFQSNAAVDFCSNEMWHHCPIFWDAEIITGVVVNFSVNFSGHSSCNFNVGFCVVVVVLFSKRSHS